MTGKKIAFAAFLALAAMGFAAPASAQATRTWVSGVGDDVNPCSRTAPCKTFAGAISKTAAGGEINCLDSGGFGTLTITKSITIDCTGTIGGVLNATTTGFNINDSMASSPGTSDVILRNVSINGVGTTPGVYGVRFVSGRSLVLEHVFIQNQGGGAGIAINPTGAISFNAQDVSVADGAIGIVVQPTGSGSVRGALSNVRVESNSGVGFRADTTGLTSGAGVRLSISDSVFARNGAGISAIGPSGAVSSIVMLARVVASGNTGHGVAANGAVAQALVGTSLIFGNGTGILPVATGQVVTYGTNQLNLNTADGAFTSSLALQ